MTTQFGFKLTSGPNSSLPLCDYVENFLPIAEADAFLEELSHLPWEQHIIPMYGKKIPAPRLFQWMGIPPAPKSYTGGTPIEGSLYGGTIKPIDWTPAASTIKQRIEAQTGETFDSLNLNFYRDHRDHLGWHVDKADEGRWDAPIASVSLGAVRTFQVRQGRDGEIHSLPLAHGSLVVMPAHFQEEWLHRLAKTTKECGPRINLTFRRMGSNGRGEQTTPPQKRSPSYLVDLENRFFDLAGKIATSALAKKRDTLEAGKVLISLKATKSHGSWIPYLETLCKSHGVTARTAQIWMQRAGDKPPAKEPSTPREAVKNFAQRFNRGFIKPDENGLRPSCLCKALAQIKSIIQEMEDHETC